MAAIAAGLVSAGLNAPASAATTVSVSGRVYRVATGQGYAGVKLDLCGAGEATTGANGNWHLDVPSGSGYCVRLVGGGPNGLGQPLTRNNPDVGVQASYEQQQAGVNCYHIAACSTEAQRWDRAVDGGFDFAYPEPGAAAPVATPSAAPTPSPSATATPVPAVSESPAPSDAPAATTAPDMSYTSNDKKAVATLPAGSLQSGSTCQVATAEQFSLPGRETADPAYELKCLTAAGSVVTDTAHPVSWKITPGASLNGLARPAIARQQNGRIEALGSTYDARSGTVAAAAPGLGRVAVVASRPDRTWLNIVVLGGFGLVILIGLGVVWLRRRRALDYQDYIAAKYYNL